MAQAGLSRRALQLEGTQLNIASLLPLGDEAHGNRNSRSPTMRQGSRMNAKATVTTCVNLRDLPASWPRPMGYDTYAKWNQQFDLKNQ